MGNFGLDFWAKLNWGELPSLGGGVPPTLTRGWKTKRVLIAPENPLSSFRIFSLGHGGKRVALKRVKDLTSFGSIWGGGQFAAHFSRFVLRPNFFTGGFTHTAFLRGFFAV